MNWKTPQPYLTLSGEDKESAEKIYTDRHKELTIVGAELQRMTSILKERGWKTHHSIWNAALFLNTVCFDHSVIFIEFACEQEHWKQSMLARTLALLIYEIGEDLPTVFGKSFRASCAKLGVDERSLALVGEETRKIKKFWSSNQTILKQVRIIAGAHRHHDALELLETIHSLDFQSLYEMGLEIGKLLNALGKVTQPILVAISGVEPPELSLTSTPTRPNSQ